MQRSSTEKLHTSSPKQLHHLQATQLTSHCPLPPSMTKTISSCHKIKQLQTISSSFSRSSFGNDPFAQPGYLSYDEREPLAANWIPFDTSTLPSQDWLTIIKAALRPSSSIQQNALKQIGALTHHTILVIGDSVDRQNIEFMSENLDIKLSSVVNHNYSLTTEWSARKAGPHEGAAKYDPRLLTIPSPVDLIITNCFIYGLVCSIQGVDLTVESVY